MKFLKSLLLYTALGLGANTAFAIDTSQFDALKTGDTVSYTHLTLPTMCSV